MKRLFGFLLTATMLVSLCTFPTYALEEGSSQESIRVPQMFACYGSIEEAAEARAALSENADGTIVRSMTKDKRIETIRFIVALLSHLFNT